MVDWCSDSFGKSCDANSARIVRWGRNFGVQLLESDFYRVRERESVSYQN